MSDISSAVKAEVKSSDEIQKGVACETERVEKPCLLVVFGATGDLAKRKIMPSLCALRGQGLAPDKFIVVGAARTEMSEEDFRSHMDDAQCALGGSRSAEVKDMQQCLYYHPVQYTEKKSFEKIDGYLKKLEKKYGTGGNRIYYLAVPPVAYGPIIENVGLAGMARETGGFRRIVIEKPFGHDLASAMELDALLHGFFDEDQVFRIDHYLAKDTVQNILTLRFANAIFEPVWNRNYIDSIHIMAAEDIGIEKRAGFYDSAGVLRDMFQNHMMQLLSLCAMEPPSMFEAERVRDGKSRVYRALRPFDLEHLHEHLVLGQYSSGVVNGKKARAYVDEPGVKPDSQTPTYATMKIFVDNWRWQGVPFYLTSGKRLAEKRTQIVIQFKEVPFSMFRQVFDSHIAANRLTLGIYPKEEISLTFQTKVPGPMCLQPVRMNYSYGEGGGLMKLDAYAKVLLDCMLGDQTLFWRQDGVELCWSFLTPILEECACPGRDELLHLYRAGSWGPSAARHLLAHYGVAP